MGAFYMIQTLLPWSFVFCFYTISDRKYTSNIRQWMCCLVKYFRLLKGPGSEEFNSHWHQQITCMLSNKAESFSLIHPQRSPHSFWRNTVLLFCAQLTCKSAFSYSIQPCYWPTNWQLLARNVSSFIWISAKYLTAKCLIRKWFLFDAVQQSLKPLVSLTSSIHVLFLLQQLDIWHIDFSFNWNNFLDTEYKIWLESLQSYLLDTFYIF